jgi:hypothetical protein
MKTLKGVIDRFEGEFAVIEIVGEFGFHNVRKAYCRAVSKKVIT